MKEKEKNAKDDGFVEEVTLGEIHPLQLSSGGTLSPFKIAYKAGDKLNSDKSNAILVKNKLYKNHNKLHFRVLNENIYLSVKYVNHLIISNILFTLLTLHALDLDFSKIKNFSNHFQLEEGRGKSYLISRYKKNFGL